MLKSMIVAIAMGAMMGAMTAILPATATAMPLAPASQMNAAAQAGDNGLTLVRDNCGRGRHFSNRRNRCVSDDNFRGPQRNFRRDDCRRGWHFSQRRGRCVRGRSEGPRNDDAAAALAIGALFGAIASGNKSQHNGPQNNNSRRGSHKQR